MKKKKVILAYSGGLDTSVCIPWLIERGYEVVCFMADVGQEQDSSGPVKRGKIAGAAKVIVEDLRQEFIRDYVWPSLKANAVYENRYPLATALSRPLIARSLVRAAHRENASAVAHGCTGKGNDQVRIEMSVRILDPGLEIIAPVREWDLNSRDAEMAYAKEKKIPIDVTRKSPYSIDQNLWGVSVECGVLENPWTAPPADCYQWTRGAEKRSPSPEECVIGFDSGVPVSLNGKKMPAIRLIQFLNRKAARFGIGRVDMVENRYVGIKSREIYESPAATVLLAAHRDLESLVLDRAVSSHKDELSKRYAEMIYQGYWFTELKSCFDALIERTQRRVTGEVRVKLSKYHAAVTGRKSRFSRYREALATYSEKDQFDPLLSKGFIELVALPYVGQGSRRGR